MKAELFWLQWEMPSIGSFQGIFDKHKENSQKNLMESTQTFEETGPDQGYVKS